MTLAQLSQLRPPIAVAGMHRSGTTLLARVLSEAGVEMGQKQDRHREALCFQSTNDILLRSNGASWLNPDPFVSHLSDYGFLNEMGQLVEDTLARKIDSFGEVRPGQPWGWKDPRTTLTLPIWLRLFPQAQVIHLIRDGVDVALSLKRRAWRNYLRPRRNDIERMFPLGSFTKGYRLWTTYLQCAERHASRPNHYHLRYEDLVRKPISELSALVDFLDICVPQCKLSTIASEVRKPRQRSRPETMWAGGLFLVGVLDSSPLAQWGYDVPSWGL